MEVLTTGEKVKQLRKEIGLKQEDITNDEISKSLISMIEKNKRSLTQHTATIIAENLNKYYKSMGREITPEYLLETEEEQVKKEIDKEISYLQELVTQVNGEERLINNVFDKVMELADQWGLKKELFEIKMLRGDYYYSLYKYDEALKEYLHVLNYRIQMADYGEIARMYIAIGSVYQMKMLIDTAIVHYVQAHDTAIIYNIGSMEKVKVYSIYNQILCYRKINHFDLALNKINEFKELKWEDPLFNTYYNRVLIHEANTYRDLKNYEKATKLYDKILKEQKKLDKETLFLLYDNYAYLYRKQGNIQRSLTYISKAYAIKDEVDINYIPALHLKEAKCYNLLENYEKVISLLNSGLQLAKMVSKTEFIIELYFNLVEVHIKIKDYTTALNYLQKVETIIIENNIKSKETDLYSYYSDIYLELDDKVKASEFIRKMRKKYLESE